MAVAAMHEETIASYRRLVTRLVVPADGPPVIVPADLVDLALRDLLDQDDVPMEVKVALVEACNDR